MDIEFHGSDGIPNVGVEEDDLEIEITLGENKNVNEAAIIFDGMAVLQSMKKTSSMTRSSHLKLAFVKRIKTLIKGYTQGRVIFDRYLDVSLKEKARAKQAASSVTMEFKVHDHMSIAKVSLKELFSNSRTKSHLTEILAKALLEEFKGSYQELVVSYDDQVKSSRFQLLSEDTKTQP